MQLVPEELTVERRRGGRWVYYKVWEMKDTKGRKGEGVDVIMTHGVSRASQSDSSDSDDRYPYCRIE